MKICYISLFYDIGRGDWNTYYKRCSNKYIENFIPFIEQFSSENGKGDYEMIVFLDERYIKVFNTLLKQKTRIKTIPIDENFMIKNFHCWSTLSRERDIMKSPQFIELISHRWDHPECNSPLYNIITHSKIDAVGYVIKNNLTTAPYIAWVDFGYYISAKHKTTDFLDLKKLNLNSVVFPIKKDIEEEDKDVMYTLKNAPECVTGYFFFGPKDKLLEYQKEYHKSLYKFQYEFNIADDDQHITLDVINRRPDLFTLYKFNVWHIALKFFSL